MSDPIKTGTRPDGSTFYWFRISQGSGSRRVQIYRSKDRRKDLVAEYAQLAGKAAAGKLTAPDKILVPTYIERWIPAHCRDLEDGTEANLRYLLRGVCDHFADRRMRSLDRADIDGLADWMLESGRRRVGKPGTPLSARTVKDTINALSLVCEDAVDAGILGTNPCRRVKRPKQDKAEHELWSDEETARFDAAAAGDRLAPVITLECLGLRPEEVCGLRWRRDIKLPKRTVSINKVRTLADGVAVEKPPKTAAGKRTLPLDDVLADALAAFRELQRFEKRRAGDGYTDGDYVLCDELGLPYEPARLRRVWYRLMRKAKVRKITPYEASRHAAGTRLDRAGVSPGIIAAWLGHADASFTLRTYVHPRPEDLATARDILARPKAAGD